MKLSGDNSKLEDQVPGTLYDSVCYTLRVFLLTCSLRGVVAWDWLGIARVCFNEYSVLFVFH